RAPLQHIVRCSLSAMALLLCAVLSMYLKYLPQHFTQSCGICSPPSLIVADPDSLFETLILVLDDQVSHGITSSHPTPVRIMFSQCKKLLPLCQFHDLLDFPSTDLVLAPAKSSLETMRPVIFDTSVVMETEDHTFTRDGDRPFAIARDSE